MRSRPGSGKTAGVTDLRAAAHEHIERFNDAVRSGDYAPFLATFARDAVMRFTNVPVGPYHGLDAIRRAYAEQPPTDTMSVRSIEDVDPATAAVAFDWDSGGPGTMTLCWRDGELAELTISFD